MRYGFKIWCVFTEQTAEAFNRQVKKNIEQVPEDVGFLIYCR